MLLFFRKKSNRNLLYDTFFPEKSIQYFDLLLRFRFYYLDLVIWNLRFTPKYPNDKLASR